jgi:hypothetical protein
MRILLFDIELHTNLLSAGMLVRGECGWNAAVSVDVVIPCQSAGIKWENGN